jgi:hypothetical protein
MPQIHRFFMVKQINWIAIKIYEMKIKINL